eukprot:4940785-Pleurochrysis_carterae.AAC.4
MPLLLAPWRSLRFVDEKASSFLHTTEANALMPRRVPVFRLCVSVSRVAHAQVDPSKERHMFKPCATLRLLMASLLPRWSLESMNDDAQRLDLVVYMDADVYIDDDLRELMATSSRFSSRQWAALAYETYAGKSWYTKGLTHGAFVKPFGINSGVMVASLARWRRSGFDAFWTSYVGHAPLGDQDVLNAYFARYPDELQILPCKWNWRIDSGCPNPITPARNGIWHGNRETFLKNKSAEYIRDYGVGSAEFDRVKQMASAFLSLGSRAKRSIPLLKAQHHFAQGAA